MEFRDGVSRQDQPSLEEVRNVSLINTWCKNV